MKSIMVDAARHCPRRSDLKGAPMALTIKDLRMLIENKPDDMELWIGISTEPRRIRQARAISADPDDPQQRLIISE